MEKKLCGEGMFVLEYSPSQKTYHVSEARKAFINNLQRVIKMQAGGKDVVDWVPVGIFDTKEQAMEQLDRIVLGLTAVSGRRPYQTGVREVYKSRAPYSKKVTAYHTRKA